MQKAKQALLFFEELGVWDAPHGNDATQSPLLLPASSTKVDIHWKYKSLCEKSNEAFVLL